MTEYKSAFADRIVEFVKEKQAVGFSYSYARAILLRFDKFCGEKFPDETSLTQEICLAWAKRTNVECSNALHTRLAPIREFGKYLNRIGEPAYVLPEGLAKQGSLRTPCIFSEDEIAAFWYALDHLKINKRVPARHIVLPMMYRVLYCCGLRPIELLCLRLEDVDFSTGRLLIRESKKRRDRIVMMSDDVTAALTEYRDKMNHCVRPFEWLFPKSNGERYSEHTVNDTFLDICKRAGIIFSYNGSIRLYDFRHTFATHRLYRWLREGADIRANMPSLSAYMGHQRISDTEYYIHFVPGLFADMTGTDYVRLQNLLPEVLPSE
jgi:integrase